MDSEMKKEVNRELKYQRTMRGIAYLIIGVLFFAFAVFLTNAHFNDVANSGAEFWEPFWLGPTVVLVLVGIILVVGAYLSLKK